MLKGKVTYYAYAVLDKNGNLQAIAGRTEIFVTEFIANEHCSKVLGEIVAP